VSTKIASIDPRSPAERAGVRPGEELTAVNGNPIVDVLDYKFYTYDTRLTLTLRDEAGKTRSLRVRKGEGQELGLNFETYLMDKCHRCANNCIFCFVDQMPKGLRETLYFKDDDERLSFLMGNYVTLTNLSPREIQRIIDLRISPINVSVHTTDPDLRVKMMGNRFAGRSMDIMRRFAQAGIQMNCQVVSCPGVNDGEALLRTMKDLAAMRQGVSSCAIVPVGLTKYREGLYPLRSYTQEEAAAVIDMVEAFGSKCLDEFDRRMFWCSDEFYLLAKRELPSDEFYDDYCQLENGVGMLRLLQVEFSGAMKMMKGENVTVRPFSMATGRAAAPLLTQLAAEAVSEFGGTGHIYEIQNNFFGPEITVAGLITGQDLIAQLKGKELGERLLLPDCMLRYHQNVFLDDITVEQVQDALGVPITFVPQDGFKLLDAILGTTDDGMPEEDDDGFFPEDDEYFRYNPDADFEQRK
jgi:putative radical SAM enzyme (TIGR03279 family)